MHELSWLPEPQADFNEKCSQLGDGSLSIGSLRALVNSKLSLNQSNRLFREINKLPPGELEKIKSEFSLFKLGLVSNSTVDLFIPSFFTSALRHGIFIEVITADFGQIIQEALDSDSLINQSGIDAVLLALDYRAFPFAANSVAMAAPGQGSADALEYLRTIRDGFHKNSGTVCILQTLVAPPFSLLGNMDAQLDGTLRKEIAEFNAGLILDTKASSDLLLDVGTMANMVGVYEWFDERQWYMSRVPMANKFIALYADHVSRLLAAMRGKSKKCLVLDLDNTLWGGVIGDDGLDGIRIGQGHPIGESFLAIQQYAKELNNLGVILAVCSKNEEEIALQAFKEHPDMLLKDSDFAVFVANWEDKASNIRFIAETLNIGLDSLVFVDDNPAEREIVRTIIPEVTVPELPKDASLIPRTLSAAGFFEMISFTADDAQRSKQYEENAQRRVEFHKAGGVDEYLKSLDMKITFSPFDTLGRKRITQLINKTNQFNLTTKRYTEKEVEAFELSPEHITIQVRLTDRFGDNGMISVMICLQEEDVITIDTWLMSCRVIKRRVEEAICDKLLDEAKDRKARYIRGIFRPTEKNKLVKEHYKALGFTEVESTSEYDVWELDIEQYTSKKPPIEVLGQ